MLSFIADNPGDKKPAGKRSAPASQAAEGTENHFWSIVVKLAATREMTAVLVDEIWAEKSSLPMADRVDLTQRVRQRAHDAETEALQAMVDTTPVRRPTPDLADLERKAIVAILEGTVGLTANEVGIRHNPDSTNPNAAISRWKKEGKVFAIERAGQTLYPQYIFDELWNPRPVVATILKVFDGYSPFRIAAWFESTNGMLNSQRPREIIASNPEAVVEAALDERQGAVHG